MNTSPSDLLPPSPHSHALHPDTTTDLILTREARLSDLSQLHEVECESWQEEQRASLETIGNRFSSPQTIHLLASNHQGSEVYGYVTAVAHQESDFVPGQVWSRYAELAEKDSSLAAHSKGPLSLYIVTISTRPGAPRGTGTLLVKNLCAWAREKDFSMLRYGIRLPHLSQAVQNGVTPDAYVRGLATGTFHEDIYRLAIKSGGKPHSLIANYYQDSPSLNYGLLMEHFLKLAEQKDG